MVSRVEPPFADKQGSRCCGCTAALWLCTAAPSVLPVVLHTKHQAAVTRVPCGYLPAKPVQPCPALILRENAQREAAELAAARSAALRAEEERTAAWAAAPQVGWLQLVSACTQ